MAVRDRGIPIKLCGPCENTVEMWDIFLSTIWGITIKTLEDIIKQLDETLDFQNL